METRKIAAVGIAAVAAMVIAIAYGVAAGSFVDELRSLIDMPWGRVTLVDLAAGLILIGAWIGWREGSAARAAPWWIAMFLTGNLASALYIARAAWSSNSVTEFYTGRAA
jgi:F0F1-type ATP synthase assembly protein I